MLGNVELNKEMSPKVNVSICLVRDACGLPEKDGVTVIVIPDKLVILDENGIRINASNVIFQKKNKKIN